MIRSRDILNPILDSANKIELLQYFLSINSSNGDWNEGRSGILADIPLINALLNEYETRKEGLLLLNSLLPECQMDDISKHGVNWMQSCLKSLKTSHTSQISFQILKQLILKSVDSPELKKHVSTSVIPKVMEEIHCGVSQKDYFCVLDCLKICMEKFNGPCGPHKKVIQQFLFSFIDYTGPQWSTLEWMAGKCINFLPQLGGGGVGGTLHVAAWETQFTGLCATLHQLLDELFCDQIEIQTSSDISKDGIDSLSPNLIKEDDTFLRNLSLTRRFSGICVCLVAMLSTSYPVSKTISLPLVVDLLCRGLAVTPKSISNQVTINNAALKILLPQIHIQLLKLLNAFTNACKAKVLQYAPVLLKACLQSLVWPRDLDEDVESVYRDINVAAYVAAENLCGVIRYSAALEGIYDDLLKLAVSDFYSKPSATTLIQTPSKKENKLNSSINNSMRNGAGEIKKITVDAETSSAALRFLNSLIISTSPINLKAEGYKKLQEAVISTLLRSIHSNTFPFSELHPRLEVYTLFLSMVLNPHHLIPTPVGLAINMFGRGEQDKYAEISSLCKHAISCVEKIVHPSFASLCIQMTEVSDEVFSHHKQIEVEREEENSGSSVSSALEGIEDILNSDSDRTADDIMGETNAGDKSQKEKSKDKKEVETMVTTDVTQASCANDSFATKVAELTSVDDDAQSGISSGGDSVRILRSRSVQISPLKSTNPPEASTSEEEKAVNANTVKTTFHEVLNQSKSVNSEVEGEKTVNSPKIIVSNSAMSCDDIEVITPDVLNVFEDAGDDDVQMLTDFCDEVEKN